MPANLHALSRYRIIDRCLSDRVKKHWTLREISDKLEDYDISVSKRTLEKDLEVLRHDTRLAFHAPIEYCRIRQAYHYSVEGYSISSLRFSEAEFETLCCGIAFVKGYEGIEVVREFGELVEKVISGARS
jgi:predicted DNA-binding transcriptional regulator YafY